MKKLLFIAAALLAASALQAQPAGGFGGFQMPKIEVRCSEKFADVDYAGDFHVYHNLYVYITKV